VKDLQASVDQLTQEKNRFKAENSMLRRNEKDRSKFGNEDLRKLEEENKELEERLTRQI